MNKLLIATLFAWLQISVTARALVRHPQAAPTVGDTTIDALLGNKEAVEKWLQMNKVPALGIGIINKGKLVQISVYGELKKGVAAPFNAIFNVASLTKPIVSMLTLKLVSNGQLSLDEPLYPYWVDPDIKADKRYQKLTPRIILSHQTGFRNWRWEYEDGKLHFDFEPGTKFQYSGEGFEYLKKALEVKFKQPLERLADSLLLTPLGMQDTRFTWNSQMDTLRLAWPHNTEGGLYEPVRRTEASAADDLMTTVEDYGKFAVAIMNQTYLPAPVFKEMVHSRAEMKEHKHMGLGWQVYTHLDAKGSYAISHGGSDKGTQARVFLVPASGDGLIMITNGDNGPKLYKDLLFHYLGHYGQSIFAIETKPE
ncbi:serine hydrolase domain-containing protein [Niabella yanshanensis]|uniref:Serine hydrolase domain-containing protein n=1 Tax=Niabella yanshanensis TaxID=577386 RepID=A0ABZ0W0V8_9BACT|nr:serine hydrolase domain-containing protein [Niabella yanshanensis]WQD36298.1 serine hydrolase domain-containing protein [Niabella yanshanensis]